MKDERMIQVENLRERLASREYEVHPRDVAAAIIARLEAGKLLQTGHPRS